MYLSMAVVRNGDRRLLKRGIRGTAEVLSAKATNEVIQEGEFAWEAPRVYKYRLRVAVPGRSPYETDCRICASGIRQGSAVRVAVSPHNHKRVTIDIGKGSKSSKKGTATADVPGLMTAGDVRARLFPAGTVDSSPEVEDMTGQDDQLSANSERIDQLARLGQLHSQGVLTDAEFAAEKAKLLGD
ncbi:MAG TPA: SHOCT domain-containing protein [Streptosporangiaceae bacterium]|nr:SHOCT domain-containing protein [Streptosporangiaceae bacterium]